MHSIYSDYNMHTEVIMQFTNPHEEHCFNNAAYFTACRGNRVMGTFVKKVFNSFAEAKHYAQLQADGRTMIYAITAQGRDAHICNA